MIVNGETFSISNLKEKSIISLLEHNKLSPGRVAVEVNGKIIKKADYPTVNLQDSDKVEIIHFVGGGN